MRLGRFEPVPVLGGLLFLYTVITLSRYPRIDLQHARDRQATSIPSTQSRVNELLLDLDRLDDGIATATGRTAGVAEADESFVVDDIAPATNLGSVDHSVRTEGQSHGGESAGKTTPMGRTGRSGGKARGSPDSGGARKRAGVAESHGERTPSAGTASTAALTTEAHEVEEPDEIPEAADGAAGAHEDAAAARDAKPTTVFQPRTDLEAEVMSIEPRHGPRAGGVVMLVRGRNFGGFESRVQVLIGGVPCIETRYLSDEALHCLLPRGNGTKLAVEVMVCGCGAGELVTPKVVGGPATSFAYFTYEEDALETLFKEKLTRSLVRPNRIALQVHRGVVVDAVANELTFRNYRSGGLPERYGTVPHLSRVLPRGDLATRHDTCALVGTSGSLYGSHLGSTIDGYRAVFRTDNAPSAYKYAADVGKRTTYQVLSHEWVEVLLGRGENGGLPHVARWWLDVATLVLWEDQSQDPYIALRWLYPDAAISLLSRDMASLTQRFVEELGPQAMDALSIDGVVERSAITSLMYAAVLAMQICQKVDVFGVFPRCGKHARRCRSTYFDDSEPSAEERHAQLLEQKLLLGLHLAGYVNVSTPRHNHQPKERAPDAADADGGAPSEASAASENEGGTPGVCDANMCVPKCGRRGRMVNGTCLCDAIYVGKECEVSRLELEKGQLLGGVDLRYKGGSYIMNKADAVRYTFDAPPPPSPGGSPTSRDAGPYEPYQISLPRGITRNRTGYGDFYRLDERTYALLPDDDSLFFRDSALRYGNDAEGGGGKKRPSIGTCALVGNSGALMHREYGRLIDAHSVVYRFNQAPTDGFQAFVGGRTTHESLNSAWVKQLIEGARKGNAPGHKMSHWNWRKQDTMLVLFELFDPASFLTKTREQVWEKERWWKLMFRRLSAQYPDRRVVVLSPQFMSWAFSLYQKLKARFSDAGMGSYPGEKPMSGFYAVMYALQVCDKVDLYGFTPYRESDRLDPLASKYHYFDLAVPRHNSHSFDLTSFIYELIALERPDRFQVFS